ncbi:MAG: ATP-binding protein [Synergistaceae bacterium]|nr:ATP-binding protein [Synergistaceae bacterium]
MSENPITLLYGEPEALSPAVSRRVLELAARLGFSGDLWHDYLTWLLLMDENPFSLSCEGRKIPDNESLCALARRDVEIWRRAFNSGFETLGGGLGAECLSALARFPALAPHPVGSLVSEWARKLSAATDAGEFLGLLGDFYRAHGVGDLAFHRAFHVDCEDRSGVRLAPIEKVEPVSLKELVGYEAQKRELVANTEAFIAGRPANNALLYGDGGTGKSTSVRALVNDYRDTSLRMVEVYRQQFVRLPEILEALGGRNYRFILFIDDLSFEEHETEYKALKAVLEGGLAARPENVLIYATSNRRHLIRETWNDRNDMEYNGDVHRSDTIEEKLSLASRFGLTLNYSSPNRGQYHDIVRALAEEAGLSTEDADGDALLKGANAWEIRHGGLSGRTAKQYVDYLAGRKEPCHGT